MSCPKCIDISEAPIDRPHVVRVCKECGREMRVVEPGENGIGIQIRAGDRFVIPSEWLKISFNPLKSRGQLSRAGIGIFANMIFIDEIGKYRDNIVVLLRDLETRYDNILKQSKLLVGLDIQNPEQAKTAFDILTSNKNTIEWWANLTGMLAQISREAIESGQINKAVWAAMCSERARAMLIFKEHLEEVVWMGGSAKRLIDLLQTWDANTENSNEGFWQTTLNQNAYALSQVFAVPLLFIKDAAYVGGMNIDRRDSKFVDYLFQIESSKESVLMEIKTPTTKLLGSKYRGTYRPSNDLSGALMQTLEYRTSIIQNISSITKGTEHSITAFNPKCALIIGNGVGELDTKEKRLAFENFRANSSNVEIITFDELFKKLETMANLFSLTRSKPADSGNA
jgi:hypothetical protein